MNLYTLYTPTHQPLYEYYFLPSVKRFGEYQVHATACPQSGDGIFWHDGWKAAVGNKFKIWLDAIEANWGGIFIWSDVDVVFLAKTEEFLLQELGGLDAAFQEDHGEACTGFFIMRANENTRRLVEACQANYVDFKSDQPAVNGHLSLISSKLLTKTVFNVSFITDGQNWAWQLANLQALKEFLPQVKVFHANWILGVQQKAKLLNVALGLI